MKSRKNYEIWGLTVAYLGGILIAVLLGNAGTAFGLNKKLVRLSSKASTQITDLQRKCISTPSLPGCDGTPLPEATDGDVRGVAPRSQTNSSDLREGQTNLLKNGSFEEPMVAAKSALLPGDEHSLGWNVAWVKTPALSKRTIEPVVELVSGDDAGWTVRDGKQFAKLDVSGSGASDSLVKLSQDIVTQPTTYALSLWFAAQPGIKDSDNVLKVYWNGELLATLSQDGTQSKDTVWQRFVYNVQGIEGMSQLQFVAGGKADGKGVFLDNASVVKQ